MTPDTIVYIASCTKLITTIACLQLVERGKVTLDDPKDIASILPEVADAKIISGEKGNFQYRTPKNKVTLRMLLNHSSGFSYSVGMLSFFAHTYLIEARDAVF
jgi:CubicO group peptidase (beta-lactamase class C family)